MKESKFYTPLRYPGGKAKFSPWIKEIIALNNLTGGHYLEPYAGGAAVALDLLFSDYCSEIHINDADLAIYNFWLSITTNTDNIIRLINDTPVTIEEWHKQKHTLANPDKFTSTEHGFATFFLNRTNRSGILKGGVIGGKAQDGKYKLDARFNKNDLIQRISKIGLHASKIHIYNNDTADLLNNVNSILPEKSLIYLDPPYYVKGQGLYRNFYNHEDHVQIKNILSALKHSWVVSYDDCNEIKDIYSNYQMQSYTLNYSAQIKNKGSEIIINPPRLKMPVF